MRISYFTLDVVNKFLVRRWGNGMGARIACPTGQPMFRECAAPTAVILDVDFLTPELRTTWLSRVMSGQAGGPALVHGHNISDVEAQALQRIGVLVRRGRLRKTDLIKWLEGAAAPSAASA